MDQAIEEDDNEASEVPLYCLNHINREDYVKLYDKIKAKYVKDVKKIWKERTDPDKFIHEDVGIAAYLMILWGHDGKQLNSESDTSSSSTPNFIDIGCGNGLLTYLLTMEKHDGFGFDVRKRKIWKSFEPQPKLLVSAFSPRNESELFKSSTDNKTWLIGNHPDELTPWIPILARKYKCNFFIIPCCSYDFAGKYQKQPKGETVSSYSCYLQFVREIAVKCGFKVVFDKLRIPSTKKACLIGTLDENVLLDEESSLSKSTLEYCESIIEKYGKTEAFHPRCAVEPVRNCTKIDPEAIKSIVTKIFSILSSDTDEKNNIEIQFNPNPPNTTDDNNDDDEEKHEKRMKLNYNTNDEKSSQDKTITAPSTSSSSSNALLTVIWNAGKQDLKFKDAISYLTPAELQHMKSQHGGFQTLIRNHGHIFSIVDGFLRLRQPMCFDITKLPKTMTNRVKTRRCYLYDNHPNKCPLPANVCRFIH